MKAWKRLWPTSRPRGAGTREGWTLIELMLVTSVLLLTMLLFSQTMGSAMTLTGVNRETGLALDGARDALERLQGAAEFQDIFRLHVPGSAPGAGFTVDGLTPTDDDPDGMVGEIRFPTVDGPDGPELHEDLVDEVLGMPRDLDGLDGIDGDDHRDDYRLLPVEVRLRWKGATGVRTLSLQTLLTDRGER